MWISALWSLNRWEQPNQHRNVMCPDPITNQTWWFLLDFYTRTGCNLRAKDAQSSRYPLWWVEIPSHWQIFWYSACKNRLCDWPKMVEHGGCVIFGHSGDQFPLFTSLEQDWLAKTAWLALKLTNVARHPCRRHSEVNFLARKMILFIPLANLISIKTLVHFPALQVLC